MSDKDGSTSDSEKTQVHEPSLTPVQGPSPPPLTAVIQLTPSEHYLKKDLLSRQIASEIHDLSSPTALARFGGPFKPLDPTKPVTPETTDFPFLRFVFVNFVQSFPFLHKDQRPLWQDNVQPVSTHFKAKLMVVSEIVCRKEYIWKSRSE